MSTLTGQRSMSMSTSPELITTEFTAAIMAVHLPRNAKFIDKFKAIHGEQYRPVTILLYLTSFTHNLNEIFMYDAYEKDDMLREEFKTWVGELTIPEPDRPTIPTKDNRKTVLLPTHKGWEVVGLHTSSTDMILTSNCQINEQGYPILPIRHMGPNKGVLRTDSGKGRIIHPLKDVVIRRVTCS